MAWGEQGLEWSSSGRGQRPNNPSPDEGFRRIVQRRETPQSVFRAGSKPIIIAITSAVLSDTRLGPDHGLSHDVILTNERQL